MKLSREELLKLVGKNVVAKKDAPIPVGHTMSVLERKSLNFTGEIQKGYKFQVERIATYINDTSFPIHMVGYLDNLNRTYKISSDISYDEFVEIFDSVEIMYSDE